MIGQSQKPVFLSQDAEVNLIKAYLEHAESCNDVCQHSKLAAVEWKQ